MQMLWKPYRDTAYLRNLKGNDISRSLLKPDVVDRNLLPKVIGVHAIPAMFADGARFEFSRHV